MSKQAEYQLTQRDLVGLDLPSQYFYEAGQESAISQGSLSSQVFGEVWTLPTIQ